MVGGQAEHSLGDDVAHERLIDERLAERRTVRHVVGGALDALPGVMGEVLLDRLNRAGVGKDELL